MKIETFYFNPDASTKTIYCSDNTMNVKGIIAFVSKDGSNVNQGNGVIASNGGTLTNLGAGLSYNTSKNTDFIAGSSVVAKDNSTIKVQGSATSISTTGQVSWSFPTYDSTYQVYGLLIGE